VNTTAKHWINGEWLAIGRETPSINPADGKPIGSYFDGGGAAAQAAIDVSFIAFHQSDWRRNGMARATALSHLADVFASRLSELIDTLLGERKLTAETTYEATHIPRSLRFASGLATQIFGRVLDPTPGKQSMCIPSTGGCGRPHDSVEFARILDHPRAGTCDGVRLRIGRQASGPSCPNRGPARKFLRRRARDTARHRELLHRKPG
jgi:Aldehyde dehydrogenase family